MVDNVSVDTSEVAALVNDFIRSSKEMRAEARVITGRTAQQAARKARAGARGTLRGIYTKHYPGSITHEQINDLTAAFGPQYGRRQAFLGKILEYGTINNSPRPHLIPAAEEQIPVMEGALARAALRRLV